MKKWRTLVRVVRVADDSMFVVFPGIDHRVEVKIPFSKVPDFVLEHDVKPGYRFHVRTYIDWKSQTWKEEIVDNLEGWESQ